MSDKPGPDDGQPETTLPTSDAVARILRARLTPESDIEQIRWLLDHGHAHGMSQAQLARFAGLDKGTLSKVLSGTYPTSLQGIVDRIRLAREDHAARQALQERPVVQTWLLTETGKFCDAVCADESIGILTGRSHAGKTTALRHYAGTHPGVVYVRMPAGGAARIFLQDLAEACGAPVRGAYDQLRRNVLKRFRSDGTDAPRMLIVDQAHETVIGRRVQTVTLGLILEIHDVTDAPVVLCATPVFATKMEDQRVAKFFEQLDNRAPFQRRLPNLPPMEDINAILRAYLLPPAPAQKLHPDDDQTPDEVVQKIRAEHGLGKLVKLIRKARRVSRNRREDLSWSHVLDTVATHASWLAGDGPDGEDGKEGL